MKFSVLIILIIFAAAFYGVKSLIELYRNGTLQARLERWARKALVLSMKGGVAVGFILLALILFPFVRMVGYAVCPVEMIEGAHWLLDLLFETESVYLSLQIVASIAIFVTEFSLLFSVLGLFITKKPIFFFSNQEEKEGESPVIERNQAVSVSFPSQKLFLNFAHLRI